jgi:hypothetical protein
MKMNRIIRILSVILMCSIIPCFAQTMHIQSEELNYFPYQPVYISITYHGNKKIALYAGANDIRIHTRYNATGSERDFHSMVNIDKKCSDCFKGQIPDTIEYVETSVLNITSDARGWIFDLPGVYSVWVDLVDGSMKSNIVTINIISAKENVDITTAENIKKCSDFSTFVYLEGGDMFANALSIAEKIANGNSSYRECMRDLLVKNYCQQSCSPTGIKRLSDPEKAKNYYDPVSTNIRPYSKIRTLTLFGRFAKMSKDNNQKEFIKAEYSKLKNTEGIMDLSNYVHKNLIE